MRREWSPDELIESWTLVSQDWTLVGNKSGATRLGFAVLLKFFELERLARTLDSWRGELLARFSHPGISNGPTEAVNLLIKKIKRVGHGFRNFANYRLRLFLHCGLDWHTQLATPIRGRLHAS